MNRRRRMRSRDAERLLQSLEYGRPAQAGQDPLADLLFAVRARPAGEQAGELPGEAAAMHAFRQAVEHPAEHVAQAPNWRRLVTRFARMSTTRLIIIVLAATSIGGGSWALASGSVHLPAQISRPGHGHGHRHPAPRPDPSPDHVRPSERTAVPSARPGPGKQPGPLPSHKGARTPSHWPTAKRPGRPPVTLSPSPSPSVSWKGH